MTKTQHAALTIPIRFKTRCLKYRQNEGENEKDWGGIVQLLSSCILCTCLAGCWDYQAINTRARIVGLGFDVANDNPEKFTLCAQIPILSQEES